MAVGELGEGYGTHDCGLVEGCVVVGWWVGFVGRGGQVGGRGDGIEGLGERGGFGELRIGYWYSRCNGFKNKHQKHRPPNGSAKNHRGVFLRE